MKNFASKIFPGVSVFLFLSAAVCTAQSIKVNAGEYKTINWHQTHSIKISSSVCPNNLMG